MQKRLTGSRRDAGISLIETGMIVVVAGLVFAAAFSSHALMKASKLRSVIVQADTYRHAFATFQAKYGNAPGDYPIAVAQWGDITQDGNADGRIAGLEAEEIPAWQHLSLSGILPETLPILSGKARENVMLGINIPVSARIPNAGFRLTSSSKPVYGRRDGNLLELGTAGDVKSLALSALSASEARTLDAKIDDGKPDNGMVFAVRGQDSTACVSDAEGNVITYIAGHEAPACRMVFWLN